RGASHPDQGRPKPPAPLRLRRRERGRRPPRARVRRGAGEVTRKRLRRLRGDRGYTLVELLVVLAIFTTVVTALVSLFTSGGRAGLAITRRFEAQQNARLALDRMRRELHCASGITATPSTPVSSITVTLPSQCPSANGTTLTVVYD